MCSGRDVGKNLADTADLVREAVRKGAQYIQTPEITTLMELDRKRLFERISVEEGNPAVLNFSAVAQGGGMLGDVGWVGGRGEEV
jgi:predicted amidohydrolase